MAQFIKNPKNSYIFGLLVLFATMYGPRLSPKLPEPVQELFEHTFFRGTVMFLAIYMAQHDLKVALIVTVIFMFLLNIVQNSNLFETFLQNYEKNMEGFTDNDTSNQCGPEVELTQNQKNTLLNGEIECINSIKQWFGCRNNQGAPLTASQQNAGLNSSDNITVKMMNYANDLASGQSSGKVVANEIKAWCPQVGKISKGNPHKERLQQGCNHLIDNDIGKCVPSKWNAAESGKAINMSSTVPDFYKGPCALINKDSRNQVYYKPKCFDKNPGNKCSGMSYSDCQTNKEGCFWKTDVGGFSDTTVYPDQNNKDLKLNCIAKNYNTGDFNCTNQSNYSSEIAKNSSNSHGIAGGAPCIRDTYVKEGQLIPTMGSCKHSGQCCNYKGDRPNGVGSHCLSKSGKCVNLDTSNSTNFNKSWQGISTSLKDKGYISPDEQYLEYTKDWKDKSGKYQGLFATPTSVKPTWDQDIKVNTPDDPEGLDWKNVYYGDDASESKRSTAPNYPNGLYKNESGDQVGLGCWVPNLSEVSKDSKWFAQVSPKEINVQQEQAAKKETKTIDYKTGYGDMRDNKETFIGAKPRDARSTDLDGDAPPVSSCSAYDPSSLKFIGTAFYPLNPTNRLLDEHGELPAKLPAYEGETNWKKSV